MAHVLETEGLRRPRRSSTATRVGYEPLQRVRARRDGRDAEDRRTGPRRITAVAAATIADLAREMAGRRTLLNASWSLQRGQHGEQPYWMVVTLAVHARRDRPAGRRLRLRARRRWATSAATAGRFAWPALDAGAQPGRAGDPGRAHRRHAAEPGRRRSTTTASASRYPDIRLVYWAGGNPFHHHQDLNRLRAGVAAAGHGRSSTSRGGPPMARHADIVLPGDHRARTRRHRRVEPRSVRSSRCARPSSRTARPATTSRSSPGSPSGSGCEAAFTEGRDEPAMAAPPLRDRVTRALRARGRSSLPSFDEFWAAGDAPAARRRVASRAGWPTSATDPEGEPARARRAASIEISSERIAGFGYADCPGHPVWLETDRVAGRRRQPSDYPAASRRQPAGDAPAQPARPRRAQPASEGRGPRAAAHASRRRRRARHRRRRHGARVQRARPVSRRRRLDDA